MLVQVSRTCTVVMVAGLQVPVGTQAVGQEPSHWPRQPSSPAHRGTVLVPHPATGHELLQLTDRSDMVPIQYRFLWSFGNPQRGL